MGAERLQRHLGKCAGVCCAADATVGERATKSPAAGSANRRRGGSAVVADDDEEEEEEGGGSGSGSPDGKPGANGADGDQGAPGAPSTRGVSLCREMLQLKVELSSLEAVLPKAAFAEWNEEARALWLWKVKLTAKPAVLRACLDEIAQHIKPEQFHNAWTPWWKVEPLPEPIPDTAHAVLIRMYSLDKNVKLRLH
ncbi:hypothetical protein T492DRAFT_935896 [Pavlovales sp. CCMP2436]|nr:hypothetical protein T492DRAFT_935896 [Pavlovales sp. CCMP2436]